jgi:hypothetical protein
MTPKLVFSFEDGERWNASRYVIEFNLRVSWGEPGKPDETILCLVSADVMEDELGMERLPPMAIDEWVAKIMEVFRRLRRDMFEPAVERRLRAGAWIMQSGQKVIRVDRGRLSAPLTLRRM